MAAYISTEHLKCFELFARLVETIPQSDYASQIPVKEALVEFDRYRVWSGNIGAGHRGESYKRSLDYRLREASFYKEKILRLLTRLASLLQNALEVVQGVRRPQEAVDDSGLDSEADQGSESDSVSDWVISSAEEDDGEVPLRTERDRTSGYMAGSLPQNSDHSELPQILSSIRITITSLYKMPIRRPAPVDRLRRNDEYSDEKTLYGHFDALYVLDLFPKIEPLLATKLGRQITRRRQLLHYRSSHNEDLKRETIESASGRFSAKVDLIGAASDAAQAENTKQTFGSQADNTKPEPSIKASTFNPKDFPNVIENDKEIDIRSEPETVSSFASTHTAQEPLVIPPRPSGPDGIELKEFECPFCCILTRVKTAAAWRKHVLRDLEPYVCTFRDCEQGDRLFESRDEWYEHEIQQHRMEYTCSTEGHEPSDDRHAFSTHMQSLHGAEMDSSVNPAVFDMFLHPSRRQSGTCALCGALAMKLKKHLSHHLERIALFALPRNQDFGDFDDSQLEKSDVSLRLLDGSAGAKSNVQAQADDGHVSPSETSLSAAEDVEIASLDTTENLYDLGLLKRAAETPVVEETVPDTALFSWDFATDKFKDARSDPKQIAPRVQSLIPTLSLLQARRYISDRKAHKPATLPYAELRNYLERRSHVFLIDDSSSMNKHWGDVKSLLYVLAYLVKELDDDGFDISFTISSQEKNFNHASKAVAYLDAVLPKGIANINVRLSKLLMKYVNDLEKPPRYRLGLRTRQTSTKPLSLYIFTDGIWQPGCDGVPPIEALIVKLTALKLPKEQVGIQFIRFGNNEEGIKRLEYLDSGLCGKFGKQRFEGTSGSNLLKWCFADDLFTFRDHVDTEPFLKGNLWKMLLGAVNAWFDDDEGGIAEGNGDVNNPS